MNTTKMQMELSFEASGVRLGSLGQRPRRLARARWWFEQMHTVVDRAFDWSTGPEPPPQQTYLTLVKAE
jgi:hypothetical protein